MNASGSALVYSTYLGGSGEDYAKGIDLDGEGGAYISSYTLSADFPTTPGAYDATIGSSQYDAFIAKISASVSPPIGMQSSYNWHLDYDDLSRMTYACSDWDAVTSTCLGDTFGYSYYGAGNLLSFSRPGDTPGADLGR
jgi:hypothetical protein